MQTNDSPQTRPTSIDIASNAWLEKIKFAEMRVPQRFSEVVASHIMMNVLQPPEVAVPLLLGIHGRPGEGKTVMTREVLKLMGVVPIPVFADTFESVEAGEPASELRRRYLRAAGINKQLDCNERRSIDLSGCPQNQLAVIMIDDLDQRIASNPDIDVQQTQNTPLLNAALMELADSPEFVDGEQVARTPIIITANHLDWLYQPVTRTGRMKAFHWAPQSNERVAVIGGIFPEFTESEVEYLIERFPERPISDFAAAKYQLFEMVVAQALSLVNLDQALYMARNDVWRSQLCQPPLTVDLVQGALAELRQSGSRV